MEHRSDVPPPEQAAEALAAIVRASRDAIMTVALDGTIQTWNEGAEHVYGYSAAEAIGRNFQEMFPDESPGETDWLAAEVEAGRSVENVEMRRLRADGRTVDLVLTLSPILRPDGSVDRVAAIAGDVTSLKGIQRELAASLERLREIAYRDPLTGVGSRALLIGQLDALDADSTDITVLLTDVDEFQYFNQTFGHSTADEVLCALAGVLSELIDSDDLLVRTGGDEFAILSVSKGPERGAELARLIEARLARPIHVDTQSHALSAGIGVATVSRPLPGLADFLLRRADIALNEAKSRGHGLWLQYDAEMESALLVRVQMEERLRRAAATDGELRLVYQPICDADTTEVTEVEALLRWDDPVHGAISPADFIPVAEKCGLIVSLGAWVLREACRTIASVRDSDPTLRLSVNVSPQQLVDPGFADLVGAALNDTGLPADRLVLEITESAIAGSGEMLEAELDKLRGLGVGLSVDDFGTGHSSLARLHALPFTTLKIDKSLIDGIGDRDGGDIIVDAVVRMSHGLGLTVVAEGVEQPRQLIRLRQIGCDLIQGYLLHRPMPFEDLRAVLRRQDANDSLSYISSDN
ncbi:MAG: EAL domain-containing protein [Nakamurella sp.]